MKRRKPADFEALGWRVRNTASPKRAKEICLDYEKLGFEAVALPIADFELADSCNECFGEGEGESDTLIVLTRERQKPLPP